MIAVVAHPPRHKMPQVHHREKLREDKRYQGKIWRVMHPYKRKSLSAGVVLMRRSLFLNRFGGRGEPRPCPVWTLNAE
jgi:hypothetical protein